MVIELTNYGTDTWGRRIWKDLSTNKNYKEVDGVLYTTTSSGEPDMPLRRGYKYLPVRQNVGLPPPIKVKNVWRAVYGIKKPYYKLDGKKYHIKNLSSIKDFGGSRQVMVQTRNLSAREM